MRKIGNPEPQPPPWGLPSALSALVAALAAMIIGTLIMLTLLEGSSYAPLLGWILGSVVTVAYIWSAFRRSRAFLHIAPTDARLFLILLFAVGMAFVIDLVDLGITGAFLPAPELGALVGVEAGFAGWVAAILFMLVAQPVAEELAFRGVFFPAVRQVLGGWVGWLMSGLAYGLFHLIVYTSDPGNLWHSLGTPVLIGLVIGGVRASTGSTRAAIVAHIGFGVFALLKLLALS